MIGIVGGVGPYAGLDLAKKIFDQTIASEDQDHLPVIMISDSAGIEDRTRFLMGESSLNPGIAIAEIIKKLADAGAKVVGIPCNTAHAPQIFDLILDKIEKNGIEVKLLHMIEETAQYIRTHFPEISRIGLTCTLGTFRTKLYPNCFQKYDLNVITPGQAGQQRIHEAIYHPEFGIKSKSNPVTGRAREMLLDEIVQLEKQGAQAVILGCTEIPLAVTESEVGHCLTIDPAKTLARSLIHYQSPEKLKPELNSE